MKHFNKLVFCRHPNIPHARYATAFFANGYGASILQGANYDPEWFEVAVVCGDTNDAVLCYDIPIKSDHEGTLEPWELERLLAEIAALPQAPAGKVD